MNISEALIEQIVHAVLEEIERKTSGSDSACRDIDIREDITSKEVKNIPLIEKVQDAEALQRMMRLTTARIGVGNAGARLKTKTMLAMRADHALAKDAVMLDVDQKLLDHFGLFTLQSCCRDKNEYLTRPDLGRKLNEDAVKIIKERCEMQPDIQIGVVDGLSSTAIHANLENILPVLMDGLKSRGLKVGTPFFIRYGRVGIMDHVSEIVGAKAVCALIGERPGLGSAESMSAYNTYHAYVGMPESCRSVVSNIHKDGINAVEAGAYITDLLVKILEHKASGVELQN